MFIKLILEFSVKIITVDTSTLYIKCFMLQFPWFFFFHVAFISFVFFFSSSRKLHSVHSSVCCIFFHFTQLLFLRWWRIHFSFFFLLFDSDIELLVLVHQFLPVWVAISFNFYKHNIRMCRTFTFGINIFKRNLPIFVYSANFFFFFVGFIKAKAFWNKQKFSTDFFEIHYTNSSNNMNVRMYA